MKRVAAALLLTTGCSAADEPAPAGAEPAGSGTCADVAAVEIAAEAAGTFRFDVTVRSADTGWEKYADRWEVRSTDGVVLGTRILTHPHETEQPFTRSLSGVDIPVGVDIVTVAVRDSVEGFCGEPLQVEVPGR